LNIPSKMTITAHEISKGDHLMTHHISKLVVALTLALAAATPLAAQDAYGIRSALASGDYGRALALTKQTFATVQSGGEASNLIQSIIASAPADQIPALVAAAIEGNPGLGQQIVTAAISGATKSEAAAILTEAYFALSQNPSPFADLLTYISDLLAGTVPISEVLTMPWFNPANTIGVGVTLSPSTPGAP
jgi:hypothetical protein